MTLDDLSDVLIHTAGDKRRAVMFKGLVNEYNQKKVPCLQVGASGGKLGPNWTCIDLYDQRRCVDYNLDICDDHELFNVLQMDYYHLIVANAVLEHVRQPFDAAANLSMLLCPDGICYVEVPFLWGFHPYKGYTDNNGLLPIEPESYQDHRHGGDYWRFTPQGIQLLFEKWLIVQDLFQAQGGGLIYVGKKKAINEK